MSFEKAKSEQIDRIREYSKEVLEYVYSKKGKGIGMTAAIRQVLINHFITDKTDVSRLMSEIGRYIKTHSDLKRWEKEAVEVPVGKSLEPIKKPQEPYEDIFTKSRRLRREKALGDNPLFADQVKEEIDEEERRRGF